MSFDENESAYYLRQILVRDFGGAAQAKLKTAHIGVIGTGGIGSPLLLYLAGAGVGQITIYEDDEVSLSNLHRQVLFQAGDVGKPKADTALEALKALNPHIQIELKGRFDGEDQPAYSLLIDGSDNLPTRQLANKKVRDWGIPLMAASLAQWEGQIAHFDPAHHAGCYHCLYPEGTDASAIPSCSEAGVIGPVAGMIGTMAALEAVKMITGIRPLEPAQLIMIDGLYRETRIMKVKPREDCPICSPA